MKPMKLYSYDMMKYMPLYLVWRHFTRDASRTPACDLLLQFSGLSSLSTNARLRQ